MARRVDKAKIRYAENCIASGMLDGAAARHIAEHFGIALSTAYDYLNLAYQEVAETVKTDTARKKGRIEAMISQAAMRSLKGGKLREFLKSVELLMRLQGLDKVTVDMSSVTKVVTDNFDPSKLTPEQLDNFEALMVAAGAVVPDVNRPDGDAEDQ